MIQSIKVKHNIEVAHRMWDMPGKCQQIHGHSMQVEMQLYGEVDKQGVLLGLEYGNVKKLFRNYLDTEYDHRLLLNQADSWAGVFHLIGPNEADDVQLPGLQTCTSDPTTENIARWIGSWAVITFQCPGLNAVHIAIMETNVNGATWQQAL